MKENPKHRKKNKKTKVRELEKPTRTRNVNSPSMVFHESEPLDDMPYDKEIIIIGHALEIVYMGQDHSIWIETIGYGDDREKYVYRFKFTNDDSIKKLSELVPKQMMDIALQGKQAMLPPENRKQLPELKGYVKRTRNQGYTLSFIENPEYDI